MYSERISLILSKANVKEGDRIRLETERRVFEGILMPRPDAGDSNVIVIKRDDGYNIGIAFSEKCIVKKLESKKGEFSFPKYEAKGNRSLPRISMIYTGGTIGSKVDYVTGGVYMLTKPEELLYEVPEIYEMADLRIRNLMSIASEDMTYKEWAAIAEAVADELNNGSSGIVITHGTDTMHYTSAALSFMLKDLNATVAITGAQRSSDRGSSDAFVNLVRSFQVAVGSDIAEVGICMHSSSSDGRNYFIRGTKARKMHTSRRDAFRPVNSTPICAVDEGGKLEYMSEYRHKDNRPKKVKAVTGFEPRVALVKTHPNSDPGIIEYYMSKGYKGIILEGTGLGHVPSSPSIKDLSWLQNVKRAVDAGIIVGVTSQCIYGRVNDKVYRNLRLLKEAGGIHCEDMMPEVAYVKLGFLLGNYKRDEVREMLAVDIAGEITDRSVADFDLV